MEEKKKDPWDLGRHIACFTLMCGVPLHEHLGGE